MTDIRIVSTANLTETLADWLLKPTGYLDETEELANLVKVALMTDRLAGENEILPDPDSTDRRGWWGDYQAEEIWGGWQIGCKNWLMSRAKIVGAGAKEGATLARIEQYTRDALAPLIASRIASYITVRARRVEIGRVDVHVTVYRGPRSEIELRFQGLWTEVIEA